MGPLDWTVIAVYCAAIVAMAVVVGRGQASRSDYYLGGRSVPAWQVACSILATQISAVSLVGGPAFIAAKTGGGLVWLQYELAVPLAMGLILAFLVPAFHAARVTTVYEFLEARFGPLARTSLSVAFMLTRGMATGVMLWTTALMLAGPLGWNVSATVAVLGGVSLLYTVIGGIRADIITDIVQLGVLWVGTLICIACVGDFSLAGVDPARLRILDFKGTGLGDGATFAFLPMLLGGFFLYSSYYGCDQSQAQRLLAVPDVRSAQRALLWNGLFRFPLALTYCAFGVLLAGYLVRHPDFAAQVKDPNDLVPKFVLLAVPDGLRGVILAGVLAAAMSSLDSAFNSLSAATVEDVLRRYSPSFARLEERAMLRWSRVLTFVWGAACTAVAFLTPRLAPTVIEGINKIGSLTYGPILGMFLLAVASRRATQWGAVTGLLAGVLTNLSLWLFAGDRVSWLWWNVAGCLTTAGVGQALRIGPTAVGPGTRPDAPVRFMVLLGLAFVGILGVCLAIQAVLT